ncbi:MAG: hypothetical protein N3D11_16535 [Candidatus Sumerlaeia bacterium]|nr:hypothetical protein [Candidatus Sumerlaeia bacterium]
MEPTNTTPPQSEILPVHDLTEAGTLLAAGFTPVGHEWRGPRLYLLFPDVEPARRILADLARGRLLLDPNVFADCYRMARRLLHEAKQQRGTLR